MARVSVVMPVYNAADSVGEAVESVLAQTLADWELIAVDDGSTDDSLDVLQSYCDDRIRVLSQRNAGAAAARNAGLDVARGEYVVFLDADDIYLPQALASNARFLDAHPHFGVVYADGTYSDKDGVTLAKLSDFRPGNVQGRVYETMVTTPLIGAMHCAMTRHQALARRGLRFDQDLVIGEDWDLFIKLSESEQFGYNDQQVCVYRVHGQNTTYAENARRAANVAEIRLRVLDGPAARGISPRTRYTVLYQLVFESLAGDQAAQMALVASGRLAPLPASDRARLLRLIASHWISRGWSREQALGLLGRSMRAWPLDARTLVLWVATALTPRLASRLVAERRRVGALLHEPAKQWPFSV